MCPSEVADFRARERPQLRARERPESRVRPRRKKRRRNKSSADILRWYVPVILDPNGVKFVRNFGGHFQTHPGAAIDAGGVCLPTPRLGCRTSSRQRRRTSRGAAPTPFRDPRRSGADAGQSEQCEGDYQTAGGAKSIRTALDSLSLPSVAHQLKHHIENELHLTAAT